MRWLALFVAALAFGQEEIRNPRTSAADAAAGAKIFRGHCAECHGLNGEGGRGPRLTTGVYFHGRSDAALFRNITDGIEGTSMPSVFFSADQVWQVVTHVRNLARQQSGPLPGDAARGGRAFRERGCLGCHLVRGEGGISGPDLTHIGSQRSVEHLRQAILDPNAQVLREQWIARVTLENGRTHAGVLLNEDTHTLQILEPAGLRSLPKFEFRKFEVDRKSAMPSYEGKLGAGEIDDLVAYLVSLKRTGRGQ